MTKPFLFLLAALAWPAAQAQQIAPTGYTGTINTPTADVMRVGTMAFGWTNSIPEQSPAFPGVGSFGSLNLGFGLLPGVEAVGRLTYNGDLHCDTYRGDCRSTTRDLSVGAKIQLPLHWVLGDQFWGSPRVAAGFSDYGGAATLYRQKYLVGSLRFGPLDVSGGYGKSQSAAGLLDGGFGSASLRVWDGLAAHVERDHRETRAGLSYTRPITGSIDLTLAASRKLSDNTPQRSNQATVSFTYHFDRPEMNRGYGAWPPEQVPRVASMPVVAAPAPSAPSTSTSTSPLYSPSPVPSVLPELSPRAQAQRIADRFADFGFSDVSVAKTATGWFVRAEPRNWRKNRLDALGAGLAAFYKSGVSEEDTLALRITFLGHPVQGLYSSAFCLRAFALGPGLCRGEEPVQFFNDAQAIAGQSDPTDFLVSDQHSGRYKPQFELSPAASYTAGTEFGLYDFSLGYTLGWEVPLAKGVMWQGYLARKHYDTDDFRNDWSYFRRVGLGESSRMGANNITAQLPLGERTWAQLVVGALGPGAKGAQIDAVWQSPKGHWRLSATEGAWDVGFSNKNRPRLFTARYAVIPGLWNIEFTQGKFFNNDRGFRWESAHMFGDYRVRFYWRRTGPGNPQVPDRFEFIGFALTLPIGPKESTDFGLLSLRGRDQYPLGLETKVAEKDNYIALGYGLYPVVRHSLLSDVMDYDRNGLDAMTANRYRLRSALREHMLSKR